jgi:hypothetical protein
VDEGIGCLISEERKANLSAEFRSTVTKTVTSTFVLVIVSTDFILMKVSLFIINPSSHQIC